MTALSLWKDLGGRPLSPEEMDANFEALDDAIDTLRALGAMEGLRSIEWDADAATVTVLTTANRSFGPFQLPSKPVRFRGPWQAGATYVPGDIVVVGLDIHPKPGAYFVLTGHTAAATPDPTVPNPMGSLRLDVEASRLVLMVPAGRDAVRFRGMYDANVQYQVNDQILVSEAGFTYYYQLYWEAPPGTAPGATFDLDVGGGFKIPAPYWARVAVGEMYSSSIVRDATRKKTLDAIVADLYDKLGTLQTLAVSSNSRLNTTADPSHSNAYTPFSVAP